MCTEQDIGLKLKRLYDFAWYSAPLSTQQSEIVTADPASYTGCPRVWTTPLQLGRQTVTPSSADAANLG
jgi:hypothetical protein